MQCLLYGSCFTTTFLAMICQQLTIAAKGKDRFCKESAMGYSAFSPFTG